MVISRDDLRSSTLTPKQIHIEGFKEDKLAYAKALIDHSYKGDVIIEDAELEKLCEELQGYPLAINLAINLLSLGETPNEIITKIVREGEADSVSERLLNAIFSRPDATKEEKEFIKQFSVFTGNVPEKAVRFVISSSIIDAARRKLQKKNLLFYSENNYEIHPLVREFCYKKLDDKEIIHSKVADYYISERPIGIINPSLEEQIFFHLVQNNQWGRIEIEIEKNGSEFILQGQLELIKGILDKLKIENIENPLFEIFKGDIAELQGRWDEAKEYYEKAKTQENNKKVKAEGLVKFGEIIFREGELKTSLPIFEDAYSYSKEHNLLRQEARALNDIGLVSKFQGNLAYAEEKILLALKIQKEIKDWEGIANSLINIAGIYREKGDPDNSLIYSEECFQISKKNGYKNGEFLALGNRASVLSEWGKLKEGLDLSFQIYELRKEIGDIDGVGISLGHIGRIYYQMSEYEMALKYDYESYNISKEVGNKHNIAISLGNIGNIYYSQGKLDIAIEKYNEALLILNEIGNKSHIVTVNNNFAGVLFDKGKIEEALAIHNECLNMSRNVGNKNNIIQSLVSIGAVYLKKNEFDQALRLFDEALIIAQNIGSKAQIASTLAQIAKVFHLKGNLTESLNKHKEVLAICKEIGQKHGVAAALHDIGCIYSDGKMKDYEHGIFSFFQSLIIVKQIGRKLEVKNTMNWLIYIKKQIGVPKFTSIARRVYNNLSAEEKAQIPMAELFKK